MTDRIYIVEDHDWLRQMLTEYIGQMPGLEVCGSASSAEAALEALDGIRPNLLVVDLTLPRMGGAELVRQVRQRWPEIPCIVLSAHSGAERRAQALEAGAVGFVQKDDPTQLEAALRAALAGSPRYPDGLESRSPNPTP